MPSNARLLRASLARVLTPLLLASVVASCREDLATAPPRTGADDSGAPDGVTAAAVVSVPGRSLAANCFQCHGTNGFASELKIAGESASEIISELNEMRAEDPRRNIMNVHAQGYTTAEIVQIANYFAAQGG